ncbi:AraC family transcriptional regulator [Paenibacillus sp. CAU 1782]
MPLNPKDNASSRGIVHAVAGRDKFRLERFEPGPLLAPFVEHYWAISYELPEGLIHTQKVLSYPNLHLAFEQDTEGRRALLYGVPALPFERTLRGKGRVLGIKFRAGGFHPFWQRDISDLTGTIMDIREALGPEAASWSDAILDARDEEAMAVQAEALLLSRLPERDPQAEMSENIIQTIKNDRDILKVEQLGMMIGLSVRQLQRLFRKYVGVSPKWAINRFRLQEAAERLERDEAVQLAELAVQLGYFDQAHLIKDFKSMLGQSPASYRKNSTSNGQAPIRQEQAVPPEGQS